MRVSPAQQNKSAPRVASRYRLQERGIFAPEQYTVKKKKETNMGVDEFGLPQYDIKLNAMEIGFLCAILGLRVGFDAEMATHLFEKVSKQFRDHTVRLNDEQKFFIEGPE
jgi:hypothetical protein